MQPSWEVESFRFTAFPTSPTENKDWWSGTNNELPEEEVRNPKTGLIQQKGPFEGGTLSITIQPNRLDWNWAAEPSPDVLKLKFSSLGSLDECLPKFRHFVETWLPQCPESFRIAFGAVLLDPVDKLADGYDRIKKLLSINFDLTNASDFSLQVNRPRPGKNENTINCLSIWSVAQIIQLPIGTQNRYPVQASAFACRLQLDINNLPKSDNTPIPKELFAPLFSELLETLNDTAVKGKNV